MFAQHFEAGHKGRGPAEQKLVEGKQSLWKHDIEPGKRVGGITFVKVGCGDRIRLWRKYLGMSIWSPGNIEWKFDMLGNSSICTSHRPHVCLSPKDRNTQPDEVPPPPPAHAKPTDGLDVERKNEWMEHES